MPNITVTSCVTPFQCYYCSLELSITHDEVDQSSWKLFQVIECRAAVAWAVGEPLTMETVQVAVPLTGEVRIKIVASGVCHTDLFFQKGGDGPDVFPCILGHEGAGIVESIGPKVTSVKPGSFGYSIYIEL